MNILWNGGKVHRINESILHLMRGQVYDIDGKTLFTLGGAKSHDVDSRVEGRSWWKEEIVSPTEFEEAKTNLIRHNNQVDYIITHTASRLFQQNEVSKIKNVSMYSNCPVAEMLDWVEENVSYQYWFNGHFHMDRNFNKARHMILYNTVVRLDKGLPIVNDTIGIYMGR